MNKSAQKKPSRIIAGSLALFLSLLLVAICLENQQLISLRIFVGTVAVPLAITALASGFAGTIIGASLFFALDRSRVNEERRLDWQAQDTKLMASIASDKEKQLEAKIATLEVALKNALKRS
jgi:uncharacterized integral membrane protein